LPHKHSTHNTNNQPEPQSRSQPAHQSKMSSADTTHNTEPATTTATTSKGGVTQKHYIPPTPTPPTQTGRACASCGQMLASTIHLPRNQPPPHPKMLMRVRSKRPISHQTPSRDQAGLMPQDPTVRHPPPHHCSKPAP